jgi:hypothetical protein
MINYAAGERLDVPRVTLGDAPRRVSTCAATPNHDTMSAQTMSTCTKLTSSEKTSKRAERISFLNSSACAMGTTI